MAMRETPKTFLVLLAGVACCALLPLAVAMLSGASFLSLISPGGERPTPAPQSLLEGANPSESPTSTPTSRATVPSAIGEREVKTAVAHPMKIFARDVSFLLPSDRVIGITFKDIAVAYPEKFVSQHLALNDVVGGMPIFVSYCGFCGSALVGKRVVDGKTIALGDFVGNEEEKSFWFRDVETDRTWDVFQGLVTEGERTREIEFIPFEVWYWRDWQRKYPTSLVYNGESLPQEL